MNYKQALLLTFACLAGGEFIYSSDAHAQNIDLSHGGQITVTAVGGFDWDQNAKSVTAYDQAKAVRGNVTVTADRLVALYRKKANAQDDKQPKPADNQPNNSEKKSGDVTQDSSGSNEIYRLNAYGHVHIYTNTDQAWGDKAVYDIDQATLVLTGKNMKLTTPQNLMTARDAMEYHSETRMSVGRGDATVTNLQDGRRIKADVLVGYSKPSDQKEPNAKNNNAANSSDDMSRSSKLEKVNAFGNVIVRTQTETVRGDRGVYVPDSGIARVVGNVHITRGSNQLNGHAAIINMHTGIAHMTEAPGRRVQGLVVPNETNQQPK